MTARRVVLLAIVLTFVIWWLYPDPVQKESSPPPKRSESDRTALPQNSHEKMLAHLRYKQTFADSHGVPITHSRTPEEFLTASRKVQDSKKKRYFRSQYFESLLDVGRTQKIVREYQRLFGRDENPPLSQYRLLGMAYLYEWDCTENHKTQDCLWPLSGGDESVGKALTVFSDLLSEFPDRLGVRWLWNVGSLALGPEEEQSFQIPGLTEQPVDRETRWPEVARDLGLARVSKGGGAIAEDFTGNGQPDLMTSSRSYRENMKFYVNQGDGTFVDRTQRSGLDEFVGGINMVQTDYNNDGKPDVYVTRGGGIDQGTFRNSLLRNNGDGTFTDVTFRAGLDDDVRSRVADWADVNRDGYLDLFVGNEATRGQESARSPLYLNQGDGTFRRLAGEASFDVTGVVKGADWGDVNNDGKPDLYVSRADTRNILLLNVTKPSDTMPRFREITRKAGVAEPLHGSTAWFWDVNNDGYQDLFVGTHSYPRQKPARDYASVYLNRDTAVESSHLYLNQGDGTFRRMEPDRSPARSFYVQGSNYGDLNLDGYPDLYLGIGADRSQTSLVPNRLYVNKKGRRFVDVTIRTGTGHVGQTGSALFADFDGDGTHGIFAVMGGVFNLSEYRDVFFENPGQTNNWLSLELRGTSANRFGVGARIKVDGTTAEGQSRTVHSTVDNGGGRGASPYREVIGLGEMQRVRSMTITWPDRSLEEQVLKDVPINEHLTVHQNRSQPEVR